MTTIALGLGAAACFAASDLTAVRAARTIGPLLALVLVVALGAIPAAVAFAALGGVPTGAEARVAAVWAILAGVAYYGGQLALYKGLRDGNVAVVAPIATLEGMVALAIATGLGERVAMLALGGIAIAVVGAVLTALEPGGGSARGVGWGLASAVLFGAASICWGHTGAISTAATLGLSKVGALVLLVPIVLLVSRPTVVDVVRRRGGSLLFAGLVNSAIPFVLFGFAALSLSAGFASILNATTPIFGAVVGYLWLHLSLIHISEPTRPY